VPSDLLSSSGAIVRFLENIVVAPLLVGFAVIIHLGERLRLSFLGGAPMSDQTKESIVADAVFVIGVSLSMFVLVALFGVAVRTLSVSPFGDGSLLSDPFATPILVAFVVAAGGVFYRLMARLVKQPAEMVRQELVGLTSAFNNFANETRLSRDAHDREHVGISQQLQNHEDRLNRRRDA
jgi:hypothetical protein